MRAIPNASTNEVRPTATYERSELVSWAEVADQNTAPACCVSDGTNRSYVSSIPNGGEIILETISQ